ncbi:MAG: hypothetical protein ACRD4E_12385, partial [Bryobacteraceae bacterium]
IEHRASKMRTASQFRGAAQDKAGLVLRNWRQSPFFPIFLLVAVAAFGQNRPPEQMEVFRAVTEALVNRDADAFLDQFDPKMPGYEKLRDEIQDLFGMAQEIGSTIDVITLDGNKLELDWLLKIDTNDARRQIVKCQVEKQGKKWKIMAFEPLEFFRAPAP